MDMSLGKAREIVKDRGAWHAIVMGSQRVRYSSVTELQQSKFLVFPIPNKNIRSYKNLGLVKPET